MLARCAGSISFDSMMENSRQRITTKPIAAGNAPKLPGTVNKGIKVATVVNTDSPDPATEAVGEEESLEGDAPRMVDLEAHSLPGSTAILGANDETLRGSILAQQVATNEHLVDRHRVDGERADGVVLTRGGRRDNEMRSGAPAEGSEDHESQGRGSQVTRERDPLCFHETARAPGMEKGPSISA